MIRVAVRQHALFAVGLSPLVGGWAIAFLVLRSVPPGLILAVGTVATVSAVLLGLPVWACALRRASRHQAAAIPTAWFRHAGHAAGALLFSGVWVWLQYALNPYRVRSVTDTMLASRSVTWQAMAGLWLYGSLVLLARAAAARRPPAPEPEPEPSPPLLDRIPIRLGNRTTLVPVDRVERLQAADDYVAVFAEGRRLLASYRLSELAAQLDPNRFVRIHRSHVVNLGFVQGFERQGDRVRVRMKNGETVPASRAGSGGLRRALGR